jgi:two-component system, NtrC family, nitrogen regulation sensor histidine kinase GlnL
MNPETLTALPSMRAIFEALPNPVLILNDLDRVCLINGAAEDFFQTSGAVLLRNGLTDLVPFASPILQAVQQVRDFGGVVNEYAVTVGSPRLGGERLVDMQTTQLAENPQYILIMLLRRSMAEKFDLQLSHQGAARAVSGMASMLAHEIKNPLSGIRGAAQLLEPTLSDSDRPLARLICDETDRIRDLVDQMEVFSDERPLQRLPINIHLVLDRVKQLIAAGDCQNLRLHEDYDPSLPAVNGNHDQLVQVFLNLAKNAVDAVEATDGPKEITFTTAFRPGVKLSVPGSTERISLPLEVCVHDTGNGVSDEIRPHIFEPFVTSKPQGRGLGLALVAKIVRDHGGVVECLKRERGTTFRILLPLIREQEISISKSTKDI